MSGTGKMCKAQQRQQKKNAVSRKLYRDRDMRGVNKVLRLLKHLRTQPNNTTILPAIKRIGSGIGINTVRNACAEYQKRTGVLFNYKELC